MKHADAQLALELDAPEPPIEGPWPAEGSLWLKSDRVYRVTGIQEIEDAAGFEIRSRCMVHTTLEDKEGHVFDWWPEASFLSAFAPLPDQAEAWAVVRDVAGVRKLTGPEWWTAYLHLPEPRPDDSRAVKCPTCKTRPGTFCKRPSGHTSKQSHAARWDAFLADAVQRATSTSSEEGEAGRGR